MRRYDDDLIQKVEDKLNRLVNGSKDEVKNVEPVSSNVMKAFLEQKYRVEDAPDYRLQIDSIHFNKEKSLFDVNTKDGGNFAVGYDRENNDAYLVYFRKIPASLRDQNILEPDNLIKTYTQKDLDTFQQSIKMEVNNLYNESKGGVRVPEKLHELLELIPKQKTEDHLFNKKIIDKAIENLGIVKKIEEIAENKNKDSVQSIKELRTFENTLFKDTVKIQKELTLITESLSLTEERKKTLTAIADIEGEKGGFFHKSKSKEEIDRLTQKVNEINIVIQNRGETLSVKEIMPSHKKLLEATFDATKAVSDLVRKTIETVSQMEHVPKRQFQPIRANVQQLER